MQEEEEVRIKEVKSNGGAQRVFLHKNRENWTLTDSLSQGLYALSSKIKGIHILQPGTFQKEQQAS